MLDYVHTGLRKANLEAACKSILKISEKYNIFFIDFAVFTRIGKDTPLDKEGFAKLLEAYGKEVKFIDDLLSQHKWVSTNDNPTIADIQVAQELEFAAFYSFDYSPYKNVTEFLTRIRALPNWTESNKEFSGAVAHVQTLVKL